MKVIQEKLGEKDHAIQGWGIHPNWDINDNRPVAYPRYQMLMDYLHMGSRQESAHLHDFPQYGAFICGSQVQLDVSLLTTYELSMLSLRLKQQKLTYLPILSFREQNGILRFHGIFFWEASMHGILSRECWCQCQTLQR